eukprot:CAMPEP_0197435330 /NCGR_PEP_ID=MMETSP1175-20131217/2946_1 /TAXON_ID=1003142 /ORGANISM="Triceratium dubium, Strain CCMP147" /LENGTH=275 /DNA_ID=CAMNT_0042964349 /DNA_START=141 /DNA_END=968 /DNA_ORIENTATION=-
MMRSSSVGGGRPQVANTVENASGDAPDMKRSWSHSGTARHIIEGMEEVGAGSAMGATGRLTVHSPFHSPIHSPVHSPTTGRILVRSPRPRASEVSMVSVGEKTPLVDGRMLQDAELYAVEKSPPLIIWIGPALACAMAYALYNIFIKKGSASINPVLGGVVLQLVAALLGACLLGVLVMIGDGAEVIQYDRSGVFWAVCAGVAVGIAEIVSFCVSGMGVQATQSIPIIIGGSVMFGSVLGFLMLGEVMTTQGWLGVLLLVVGISLVATDPGQNAA